MDQKIFLEKFAQSILSKVMTSKDKNLKLSLR